MGATVQASTTALGHDVLAAALAYARRGWPVFPLHGMRERFCTCRKADCTSPGKHPITKRGFKDASTDEETIERWWQDHPYANVGVVTGKNSGIAVIDVDGNEGEKSLADLEQRHGATPVTLQTRTGGGGRHLFFSYPTKSNVPSRAGVAPASTFVAMEATLWRRRRYIGPERSIPGDRVESTHPSRSFPIGCST